MKRFLKGMTCVLVGLFMLSVVPSAHAQEELTFGYVAGVQDPFMVLIQKGAEDKAKEIGGVEIISQIPGVWNVDTQSPMWRAMASRGVDLVFGCPVDKEALIPVLKDVHERGIPVITTDTYIGDGDYTEGSDSFVLSAIHTDNVAAGEKAGHALAKLIGEKGKVYLQEFHVGVSTSDERSAGFIKAIEEYPDIELVAQNSCDDDQDLAQTQTAAILKAHPDIAGVFGNNLFACLGSATAVHNAGLSGAVKVVGFDVTPNVANMIRKGWMDAAVSQKPYTIGQAAVEWGVKYLREGTEPPKKINIDAVLFTTDNIDDPDMDKWIYK
ncbi:substrate-binding domain-containing protein [candidate division KSB3 bacterium]|uniref:Substrate-binding domain-containing protein n=1 Tax=candidate division KSB3 bacterium TaxID=2044937 RepID=A0A9D5Q8J3_9BACT|nr:substrate-binding domain-containing protein [candidate division KSB3 bacterium]MBD3327417.1 substrate-binding domain-containing protein [candidate division KSB3 bacterium]